MVDVKKLSLVGLSAAAMVALAAPAQADMHQWYMTGQIGSSYQNMDGSTRSGQTVTGLSGTQTLDVSSTTSSELTGRLGIGYNFSHHYGVEFGVANIGDGTQNIQVTAGSGNGATGSWAELQVDGHIFDLALTGSWGLQENVELFGKVGVAYVDVDRDVTNQGGQFVGIAGNNILKSDGSESAFRPELGFGVRYWMDNNLGLDFSYSHVWGRGNAFNGDYIPDVGMTSVGVTYRF